MLTVAKAQTFITPFSIDSIATVAYSVLEKNESLYVLGVNADTSIDWGVRSFLARFDNEGNKLSYVTFRPPGYVTSYAGGANSLIPTSDNGMVTTGILTDTASRNYVLFLKFDSLGNVEFYKTYQPAIANFRHTGGYKIIECDSAYYIIGETQRSNYYVEPMLIKTDLAGNLQFVKTYNTLPYLYGGGTNMSFTIMPNGNLLLCEARADDGNVWDKILSTCFLEIDTAGNLLNQHCTAGINTHAHYNIAVTHDNNYISCGSYYAYRNQGSGYQYNNYVAKWDTGFNILWDLKLGYINVFNAFTDFMQNPADDIILCGHNLVDTIGGGDAGFNGCLAKISATGNLNWFRNYKVPTGLGLDNSHNWLYDIDLLPNEDIVAVGSWQWNSANSPLGLKQLGWLLRVNSDGCMDDGSCGVTDIDESAAEQEPVTLQPVVISPNPSDGVFAVNSTVTLPAATTIDFYDVNGKRLSSQMLLNQSTLVNLNHLPAGVYFYEVSNGITHVQSGKVLIQK
ncbi:MAG TPA: T9SS type A sorting domain-containing protein [Chitinophagales bacterium]|nr:T9SS type A sorting domain-containing protein [Chitinophagales bacterium]